MSFVEHPVLTVLVLGSTRFNLIKWHPEQHLHLGIFYIRNLRQFIDILFFILRAKKERPSGIDNTVLL